MSFNDILASIAKKAKQAVDGEGKPGGGKPDDDDDKKKPPFLTDAEMSTKKGHVKSLAEKLLSEGSKIANGDKAPDAAALRKLRGLMNELGSVIDRYPPGEGARATKTVDMTVDQFGKFAESEIESAVADRDTERAELLQENVASIGKQLDFCPRVETLKVSVFSDPGQHKTTATETPAASASSGTGSLMGSFTKTVDDLKGVVDSLKTKAKDDDDNDEVKAKEVEEARAKKAKEDEAKDDEDETKRRKAAGESDETDDEKKKRRALKAQETKEDEDEAKRRKAAGESDESDEEKDKRRRQKTAKAANDKTAWPLDMNKGRDLSEAEAWGRTGVGKSAGDRAYRDFGEDPAACRK